MRTTLRQLALVMVIIGGMGVNSRVAAQPPVLFQGWARSHVDLAGSVGLAATSNDALEKYVMNFSGGVDVTVDPIWSVRARVERSTFGAPGTPGPHGLPEVMSVTRMTVGMTRGADAFVRSRVRPYVTGNLGVYHYGFVHGRGPYVTSAGANGGFGFESLMADGRAAFTGELLLHAVPGPVSTPLPGASFLMLTYTFGLKARF